MPFEFSPYHNDQTTQTIASLLSREGEIQANAVQQRGQAWGNAAQSVGHAVAAIPQEIQQQKDQAQDREVRDLALQKAKQDRDDLVALDKAYTATGGRDAILSSLPGHMRGAVLKQFEDQDRIHNEAQKAQTEADRLSTEAFADSAVQVRTHGYDPKAAQLALSDLKLKYAQNPARLQQLQQAEQALHDNPTADTVKGIIDPLIAASPERAKIDAAAAKQVADQANTNADNKRQADTQAETERHNKEVERIQSLTAGREVAAQTETARHNKAMETAANPFVSTGGTAAAGAGEGPHGEAFLKTLSPAQASEVKAYAEGRRPFPSGMSYFRLQPLIALVGQYDPTFDAGNYNARNKARTDLTSPSGTGGKTINALNTAIQHAGKLSDLIETLDNFESPLANAVVNPLRTATGSTKVTNYNAVAPQLAKEIERAWRGTGGSAGEIKDLIATIGSSKGKQQQREALQQFIDLAKGKLDATQQQRDNIMGAAGASIPVLFDQNQAIIDRIAKRAAGDAAPTTAPSTIAEGTNGTIDGKPAVWRNGDQGLGWYAR